MKHKKQIPTTYLCKLNAEIPVTYISFIHYGSVEQCIDLLRIFAKQVVNPYYWEVVNMQTNEVVKKWMR